MYNGPFRITQISQGSFITLERNSHWKGQTPDFNRLIFKVVENTAALEAHLLSGSVDYVPGELGFSIEQALQ
ncbi:ABC transporter substrate-binding protein, partial [Guyparkeria sp. 1SP6A2]|nr:ABC transporter substrate-binding protein [Guyparkeria sp. 1SP6A2]